MKTLLLSLLICATLAAQDWVPTFADEFGGAALDLSRWTLHEPLPEVPDRRVRAYLPEAISVSGGQLHIALTNTTPEPVGGIVTTYGMFAQLYGRFEVRFRPPAGPGTHAEFILLPMPAGKLPRIDAFAASADSPDRVYLANHWGTEQTERSYSDSFAVPDLSQGFHTVALEWERERITWFVDGKKTFESKDGVPQQPMYLVIDLTVKGQNTTSLPASFDVDYVRVYKRAEK